MSQYWGPSLAATNWAAAGGACPSPFFLGWPWVGLATRPWPKLCPWLEMAAREGQGRYIHGPWVAALVLLQRLVVSTVTPVPSCAVDFQMSIAIFTRICYKHTAFTLHTNVHAGCPSVPTWAVTERSHSGIQHIPGDTPVLIALLGSHMPQITGRLVHKTPEYF